MKSRIRRARAFLIYVRKPLLQSAPLFLILVGVLIAGAFAFQEYYDPELNDGRPLTFTRALYITYALVFMEHLLVFPNHWLLQLFYFVVPVLGLVVILDGIVRFSYHVLRRDETTTEWIAAMSKTLSNHVVLFGLGKVGLRVLEQLIALREHVVVLEKNPDCPNFNYARRHGIPVLVGSGREDGLMETLNVCRAKSAICVTDDDLANLEFAIDARKENDDVRIVLRMYDQELAEKIRETMGIKLAFSTSVLSAPLFATAASDRSIVNAFYAGEQLLVVAVLELHEESELVGRTIGDMGRRHKMFVLVHARDEEERYHPTADVCLRAGDRLLVQTDPATLRTLHALNKDHGPDPTWRDRLAASRQGIRR